MVACLKWKGPQAKLLDDIGTSVIDLRTGRNPFAKYTTFLHLKRVIRDTKIDIVHTHNTGPLLDTIAARLTSCNFPKIIHTDHNRALPEIWKYMAFERIASRFVDSIVAVSEEAKQKLVRFEHIPSSRIDIVDNGIPTEKYHEHIEGAKDIKQELGIDLHHHVIGLCAVHRKEKGIVHLLHALPEILAAFPNVVCVIGGGGPEKETLERIASDMHLRKNVRFIGPRDDVEKILPIFDIYILPSEWEGLPLSLLEAMAAQRCIVATAVGAVPKVLENGKCGLLIQPKDPAGLADVVISLLKSSVQRTKLASEAYRCVKEKYSAKVMAANYAYRYKALMNLS